MTTSTQHLQIYRSTIAGNTPNALLPGEIAINVVDKLLFVGTGDSYFTQVDGTQTASSTPLQGWFAVSLNEYPDIVAAQQYGLDALSGVESATQLAQSAMDQGILAQEIAENKVTSPTTSGTAGQVLSWDGTSTVWVDQSSGSIGYSSIYENFSATTVQDALDFLYNTDTNLQTNIDAAQSLANDAYVNAGQAADSAAQGISDAAAAQLTADQALAAANQAQTEIDALETTVEGQGDLITSQGNDIATLTSTKQDSLGAGEEGQFLRYLSGSPTWSSFDPKLGSVSAAADVDAFAAIQAGAGEGDVVVIADAYGLGSGSPAYSVDNLASPVADHFGVTLINDYAGHWLLIGAPGSLTQAAGDAFYVPQARQVSVSDGLSGGGNLSSDVTIGIQDHGISYEKLPEASGEMLVGAGAAGSVGAIALGAGLSISGGTLTYTTDYGTF